MDDLTPPLLTALREIRWHMLAGHPVGTAFNRYLKAHHDPLAVKMGELWALKAQGNLSPGVHFGSHRAQTLWELVERGHQGQPILEPLTALENDVEAAALMDLEIHIAELPFKALVPLLLFQFPAFVLLLVGPLLRELGRHLQVALLLTFLLPAGRAAAAPLSALAIKKFSAARSERELSALRAHLEKIHIARMACELQLKSRSVPSACYQALILEREWGAHSPSELRRMTVRLDRRCAEVVRKASPTATDVRFLSAPCRAGLARAVELDSYRRGSP